MIWILVTILFARDPAQLPDGSGGALPLARSFSTEQSCKDFRASVVTGLHDKLHDGTSPLAGYKISDCQPVSNPATEKGA